MHLYDCKPLIRILQTISDAGRKRKEAGTDDAAVKYARLAFLGLDYLKANERGDIDEQARLIDRIWDTELG